MVFAWKSPGALGGSGAMSCLGEADGKKIALDLMSFKPKKLHVGQTAPPDSLKLREGDLALLRRQGGELQVCLPAGTGSFAPSGTELHH